MRQAQSAASDKDVLVMGGPTVAQQALRAGLVDEISLNVVLEVVDATELYA